MHRQSTDITASLPKRHQKKKTKAKTPHTARSTQDKYEDFFQHLFRAVQEQTERDSGLVTNNLGRPEKTKTNNHV